MKSTINPKVLIVDDKPANLLVLENLLEGEDCILYKANSGNQALELVLEHDFALVLMDVQMPVMDGFETAKLMRGIEKTKHLPIIFITALNKDSGYLSKGYEAGAVDYLFKPLNPVALKGKVQVFLDLYKQKSIIEKQSIELQERVQESLNAKNEAERANRAKSEFLSNMSHELRTPLNAIIGFAQIMAADKREPLTNSHLESVNQVLQGGKHLLALINDILDLSHIESGKFTLSVEKVDLNSIMEEVKLTLESLAENRRITLVDQTREELKYNVCVDRLRLKQILLNLGSNAVKYNKENGKVILSSERLDNNFLRINVADTGPGISEDKQKLLFEPFNRLDRTFSEIEGTGIGLTIVKKLIELMNGKVGFDSCVGEGTRFFIDVPLATASSENGSNAIDEGSQEVFDDLEIDSEEEDDQKIKALYAEDNPANIVLVQRIMEHRPNIELLIAKDGKCALQMAREHKPSIILLDIHMPEMTGIQVVKKIRTIDELSDTPVIAVSASALKGQIKTAIEAGFDEYVTKPIEMNKLLNMVDKYLLKAEKSTVLS